MAIGRKIIGPRKIVLVAKLDKDEKEPATVDSYLADDAVDVPNSDLVAYRDSLFDPVHLKFFPDKKPTWFNIRPLLKGEKDSLVNLVGNPRLEQIIKIGCLGVENYQLKNEDGSTVELPALVRTKTDAQDQLTQSSYDSLELTINQVVILAAMIWHISETSLPLSKCSVSRVGHSGDQKDQTS